VSVCGVEGGGIVSVVPTLLGLVGLDLLNYSTTLFPISVRLATEKDIDTGPFREAVWYYIHSIKGIRHDDYHYRKVSKPFTRAISI